MSAGTRSTPVAASRRIRLGELEIVALADGAAVSWPEPLSELFPDVTPEHWSGLRARHPELFGTAGGWRLDVLCYLIRGPGWNLLVDTGMGPAESGYSAFVGAAGSLPRLLATEGLRPDQVEMVFFTHLHPDHIGWNRVGSGAARGLTFDRASYRVPALDWETFQDPGIEAGAAWPFVADLIDPLAASGRLGLVAAGEEIRPGVTVVELPGHTIGHAGLAIVGGGREALLCGDAFLHPAQVERAEVTMLREMDQAAAIATRRRVLDGIVDQEVVFLGSHFPDFGRLRSTAEGVGWTRLADEERALP